MATRTCCRLVTEDKKVELTCWSCQVEEFCVPGPSQPKGDHCELVCESCDPAADPPLPAVVPKKFAWTEWMPGSATLHARKKLMKRTVTKKIPSYKWVVEELCDQCRAGLPPVVVNPSTPVPPPPALDPTITLLVPPIIRPQ